MIKKGAMIYRSRAQVSLSKQKKFDPSPKKKLTCATPRICRNALARGLLTAYATRYNKEPIEYTAALSTIIAAKLA